MAVVQAWPAPHYLGLSTDTKPAATSAGARFFETDTRAVYVFDGAAWRYTLRSEL